MAETTNATTNNALGEGGEHVTNTKALQDVQAEIKSGAGSGTPGAVGQITPKPAPAPKRHSVFFKSGGKRR